jgi:hypothetical protein
VINQFNAYIFSFALSGVAGGTFLFSRSMGLLPEIQPIVLTNSVLFFAFGLLTLNTKPKRLISAQRKAHKQAKPILRIISEHTSSDKGSREIRVVEIAQQGSSAGVAEEDIYRLYDMVPASFLPERLEAGGPSIDWYSYDLCIISAESDLTLARRIENALRMRYPKLRVFVDDTLVIGPQIKLFKRIYGAGSRLCLALVSVHLVHDKRRREQLNEARMREKISV